MGNHATSPQHFGPAVASSPIIWIMLRIVIALERTAGAMAAQGPFLLNSEPQNSLRSVLVNGVVWLSVRRDD
jgi:hypothetical protein